MLDVINKTIYIVPLLDLVGKNLHNAVDVSNKLKTSINLRGIDSNDNIVILSKSYGIQLPAMFEYIFLGKSNLQESRYAGLTEIKDTTINVEVSSGKLTDNILVGNDYIIVLYDVRNKRKLQTMYYNLLCIAPRDKINFVKYEDFIG